VWKLPVIAQLLRNPNGPGQGTQANEVQPDRIDERAGSLILSRNQQSVRVEVLGGIMMGQTIPAMSSNMKSW
jgi:hypothetical protein